MLLAYNNRNLCDGFVSANTVRQKAVALADADAVIALMVQMGLLQPEDRDGIAGYRIHPDFMQLQPTRAKVEHDRALAKARKDRWLPRHAKGNRRVSLSVVGTVRERKKNGEGTA
jgi:hypothetical protein